MLKRMVIVVQSIYIYKFFHTYSYYYVKIGTNKLDKNSNEYAKTVIKHCP